jgi:hypothetical protein
MQCTNTGIYTIHTFPCPMPDKLSVCSATPSNDEEEGFGPPGCLVGFEAGVGPGIHLL